MQNPQRWNGHAGKVGISAKRGLKFLERSLTVDGNPIILAGLKSAGRRDLLLSGRFLHQAPQEGKALSATPHTPGVGLSHRSLQSGPECAWFFRLI